MFCPFALQIIPILFYNLKFNPMKNKTIMAVAMAGLAFASCKKDRTCECTSTGSGASSYTQTGGTTSTNTYTNPEEKSTTVYKKAKKSDLKTICGDQKYTDSNSFTNVNGTGNSTSTTDVKCKLK